LIVLCIRYFTPELVESLNIQWILPKSDTSVLFIIFFFGSMMRGHSSLIWITSLIIALTIILISAFNINDLMSESTLSQFNQLAYNTNNIAQNKQSHTSIPSSICFIIASMAFMCSAYNSRTTHLLYNIFTMALFCLSYSMLTGHVFNVPLLYNLSSAFSGTTVISAIQFMLVSYILLFRRPDLGLMRIISDTGHGGLMARVLLPVALFVPFMLEFISSLTQYSLSTPWITRWNEGVAIHSLMASVIFFWGGIYASHKIVISDNKRREAEDEMQRLVCDLEYRVTTRTAEISAINEELTTSRDAANLASQSKSDFLAFMTHELRTPMNAILGYNDLLLMTSLNEKQEKYAKAVREATTVLLAIIADILDFAAIERGRTNLHYQEVNIRTLFSEIDCIIRNEANQKKLSLSTSVKDDVPAMIICDDGRIKQVALNLIENAIKYTDNGSIEVSVVFERDFTGNEISGYLNVLIKDTGIGIADDNAELIFEKFRQVDSSYTRKYEGIGLGLAISKKLCELMGGKIGVDSKLGIGSSFWFYIPCPISLLDRDHAL